MLSSISRPSKRSGVPLGRFKRLFSQSTGRVGFVGIGNMGSGMVNNLAGKGFEVSLFDLDRAKLIATRDKVLKQHGLKETSVVVEESLSSLAKRCPTVCVSLTNEDAGRKVFFSEGGLGGAGSKVRTVVDHSTVSCQFTQDCHQQFRDLGVLYLDAPVSGGPEGAAKGTLSIMVGAPASSDFESVRPVLEAMGSFVRCMGPSGTGTAAKLINQLLTGVHIVAAAEAYTLARGLGISDTSSLLELLSRSWGNSTMLQRCGSELVKAEKAGSLDVLSTTGAPIRNFSKDFKTIASASDMAELQLPLTDRAREQIDKAVAQGLAEWDIAAMVRIIERSQGKR